MITLRDMRQSDIENYVRWFTEETEWCNWDAPWEKEQTSEDAERASWTEYYESVRDLPNDVVRWKFEIEYDGQHIGWVSRYYDLGYMDNPENIPAVGIDIPGLENRGKGVGEQALRLFMDYLHQHGCSSFYTQTWSGNTAMLRLAEKLGFREVCRKRDLRTVNGKAYDAVTLRRDMQ